MGGVTATQNHIAALKHSDYTLNSFVQYPAQIQSMITIQSTSLKNPIADLESD